MTKNRYAALFIFLIFLASLGVKPVMAEEGIKDIEIIEPAINFTPDASQYLAYLCMDLKNNGSKNIANLNLEIIYYGAEGHVIKKAVLKNKLTEIIPPGETRRYKIPLNRDVFNERYEEYPYSRRDEVNEFDIKISNIRFTRK